MIHSTERHAASIWSRAAVSATGARARIVSIEQEATPAMIGAFAIPDNILDNCLNQSILEPDGVTKRRPIAQQNHNPTVFKDLVFTTWYGQGLRVIDISNPHALKEVAYYMPDVPKGSERVQSNDVTVDNRGLIYLLDRVRGLSILERT